MTISQTLSLYAIQALPYLFLMLLAAIAWVRSDARAHIKNLRAAGIVDRLLSAAETAVQAVEQTIVPGLKAKSGGTLSATDAIYARSEAIQLAKASLGGSKWLDAAKVILGVDDIQAELVKHVEAAVLAMTPHDPPAPVPAAAPAR